MKLAISHNWIGFWLRLFVAFLGLLLIPEAMGESNCTKYCFESLCSQPNGTEVHDHSNCLNANMNCSVTTRDKKVKHSTRPRTFREYAFLAFIYYLLFVSALIAVYLLIILFYYVGQYCGLECNWCRETINFVAGFTWIEATSNTTGSDPEISMSSQPSDSQTGSPQSSSGSSIVIPMDEDESQFPLPEDDLPPEYHHPPQYPPPPEYRSWEVDVDEPESPDIQPA